MRFLDAFERKFAHDAREPQLDEARPSLGRDMRQFVLGNYVAYDRPEKGGVEPLRILHGSRDIHAAWRERSDS
ncbi:MAG: type II toxin-antitoxin system RelE/ParE family toxin [Pirellulales bacterium]|nr:type II toxin-antitoxin system RelE/ParE family toxin [Pirellulales bacterium]